MEEGILDDNNNNNNIDQLRHRSVASSRVTIIYVHGINTTDHLVCLLVILFIIESQTQSYEYDSTRLTSLSPI